MGNQRQKHPARDKAELRVEARLRLFDILMSKEMGADDAAKKAKEISNQFTEDYDSE